MRQKQKAPCDAFSSYILGSVLNLLYSGSAAGAVLGSKVVLVILAVVLRLIVCNFSNLALSVDLN
jgi:hypothetical protein